MNNAQAPDTGNDGAPRRATSKRDEYTPDNLLSLRCLSIAARHGHSRRKAAGCQLKDPGQGGTVGCPECPYNRPMRPGKCAQ